MVKPKQTGMGISSTEKTISRVLRGRVVKISNKENEPTSASKKLSKKAGSSTATSSPLGSATLSRKDFCKLVKLGSGGFATVYRAFMPSSKLTCVLKFLNYAHLKKMNSKVEDIELERSLHMRLNHPNICKLIGFFETRISSVLVLEYCSKGDLYDYINRSSSDSSPFPKNSVRSLDYIRQLVIAVDHFQKTVGYIHMDIKPENILVTAQDVIKLTDFGCCVEMKSPRYVHYLHNGGTKVYRPPELIRQNNKHFDSTVDVWGIGCIAFQLLAENGEHPFYLPCRVNKHLLAADLRKGLSLMASFQQGICHLGGFDKMTNNAKTFLRQTIGTEREQRPLVSSLLHTALLTETTRPYNSLQ